MTMTQVIRDHLTIARCPKLSLCRPPTPVESNFSANLHDQIDFAPPIDLSASTADDAAA